MTLDLTTAPTYAKVLPFVLAGAGLGLAKYQKKTCVMCYVGYAAIGFAVGSIPLLIKSKD